MGHDKNPKAVFEQNGRKGTHLDKVNSASPKGYLTSGHNNVHHIVCHSCVQDSSILVGEVDKAFIRKCMRVTSWDVNNPKNLIGLPLKSAYFVKAAEWKKWDMLPCHQIDHNPDYTEKVKSWLHDNIWSNLKGTDQDCEEVPESSLASMLDRASKYWQSFLTKRGAEQGGTKACWDGRNSDKKDVWWIPFSMHFGKDIPKRAAPADTFKWKNDPSSFMFKIT